MIGNFHEILDFNSLFLKYDLFILYLAVGPPQSWGEVFVLVESFVK